MREKEKNRAYEREKRMESVREGGRERTAWTKEEMRRRKEREGEVQEYRR